MLGRRLGEMHAILARDTDDPAFAPELAGPDIVTQLAEQAEQQLAAAFAALQVQTDLDEAARQDLAAVMAARESSWRDRAACWRARVSAQR